MKLSIEQIKSTMESIAERINAPKSLLPAVNDIMKEVSVELDDFGNLYWVTNERANIERSIMFDLDDLLYHVFKGITYNMTMDFEMANKKDNKDNRRVLFEKQEELMGNIKDNWKQRIKEEHKAILKYTSGT